MTGHHEMPGTALHSLHGGLVSPAQGPQEAATSVPGAQGRGRSSGGWLAQGQG